MGRSVVRASNSVPVAASEHRSVKGAITAKEMQSLYLGFLRKKESFRVENMHFKLMNGHYRRSMLKRRNLCGFLNFLFRMRFVSHARGRGDGSGNFLFARNELEFGFLCIYGSQVVGDLDGRAGGAHTVYIYIRQHFTVRVTRANEMHHPLSI